MKITVAIVIYENRAFRCIALDFEKHLRLLFLLLFFISSCKVLSLCKLLKFCHWTFFSLFVLRWTLFTALHQQQWRTPNARNSELNALTHNIPLRSLLLSDVVRYGLSALYYTQVRRLSGICLELCEQDKPGAISQGRRGPEEKVCRRQPGEGVWERVICLIQNTVGGPESSARGRTHPAQSLLKDLKER